MKKRTFIILAVAAVVLLAALAFAATNSTTANKTCKADCAKFVDANHDGICDLAAQCHKDGKCSQQCKTQGKDAKCDPAKCGSTAKCDPTKCMGHQGAKK